MSDDQHETPENLLALRTGAMRLELAVDDAERFLRVARAGGMNLSGKGNPAAAISDTFKRVAEHGATFLFTDDMQSVLEASVQSMPPYPLHPDDLFAPEGFVIFPRPVALPDDFHEDIPGISDEEDTEPLVIRGLAWTAMTPGALKPQEGAFLTFMFREMPYGLDMGLMGLMRFGDEDTRLQVVELFTLALFRLLHQRIATVEPVRRRSLTRAATRAGFPGDIRHVALRRASGQREGDESGLPRRGAEYSHRWMVQGHWRQQWYPSQQRHARIWIFGHVRGPKGKPLVAKPHVFDVKR